MKTDSIKRYQDCGILEKIYRRRYYLGIPYHTLSMWIKNKFAEEDSEEDIKTIMEKTGCSEEDAKQALEENNNDLAEAILALS